MFSISTMASSTNTPATNDNAKRLMLFSVKSIHCMNAKVGIADSGMADAEIAVDRASLKKSQTTNTASNEPSISA
jgi:hypothetical protein